MPPRGRKRERAPAEDVSEEAALLAQQEEQEDADQQAGRAVRRQQTARDVARRRAAHFANFQEEQDAAPSNARTLGPWSSARELVDQREAAISARQERILEASRARSEATTVQWTPRRDVRLGDRRVDRVPCLLDLCTEAIVECIDDVESLWGLPDAVKVRIAAATCKRRRLSPEVALLFAEGAPDEVVLPDCAQLEQQGTAALLKGAATPRLERLELDMCGHGMTDEAAAALARGPQLEGLRVLTLGGAYRLGDGALVAALRRMPALEALGLRSCPRLTEDSIKQLPKLVPQLRSLDLQDCRGISAVGLQAVLLGALPALHAVMLDGLPEVTDELLCEVALATPVRRISICRCSAVSDAGLRGLAAGCPELAALQADHCHKITDAGILALAEGCSDLQELSIKCCQKVTDEAVAAVALKGTLRRLCVNAVPEVGPATIKALATAGRARLEDLDVSWCRRVSPASLGMLADNCEGLRRLALWGCSQVDARFLHGHSNERLAVEGAVACVGKRLDPARAALDE